MDQQLSNYLSSLHFKSLNEEHKVANLFFGRVFVEALVLGIPKYHGVGLKNVFMEFNADFIRWAPDIADFDATAQQYFNKLKTDPAYGEKVNGNLFASIDKVNAFSRELLATDFSKKTNAELAEYCDKYYSQAADMICWGFFSVIMEIHQPLFTNFLTELVSRKKEQHKLDVSVSETVAVLSSFQGETETKKEHLELTKLALKVKTVENLLSYEAELKRHAEKYGWLAYGFGGPAHGVDDFRQSLLGMLNENKGELQEKLAANQGEQIAELETKLKLTQEEKLFFAVARGFMKGKALRKEAMSFAAYASEPLHREIAKRLNLTFLQVRYMMLAEVKAALLQGVINESELTKRTKRVVYAVFQGGKYEVAVTGNEAEEFAALIKEEKIDAGLAELCGTCACVGRVSGVVKIINRPHEMAKMQKGDVLVSYATTPDLVPAMRIASAIVTDQGGLTSHAAIVSRELNVPCVIGTKIATKWLKDGDKVEVDAGKGTVRKL